MHANHLRRFLPCSMNFQKVRFVVTKVRSDVILPFINPFNTLHQILSKCLTLCWSREIRINPTKHLLSGTIESRLRDKWSQSVNKVIVHILPSPNQPVLTWDISFRGCLWADQTPVSKDLGPLLKS